MSKPRYTTSASKKKNKLKSKKVEKNKRKTKERKYKCADFQKLNQLFVSILFHTSATYWKQKPTQSELDSVSTAH